MLNRFPSVLNTNMNQIIDSVVQQLIRQLGDQLEAIFLFGSYTQGFYQPNESDINLFVIVEDGLNIHVIRRIFAPLWEEHGQDLRRAPFLASKSAFARHLALNPLLAHHLERDGQQLFGAPDLLTDLVPKLIPSVAYAQLAGEALYVSQALLPELLDEETAVVVTKRLRSFARRVRREPIPPDENPKRLFASIQHYVNPIVKRLPVEDEWQTAPPSRTTSSLPLLPGLCAIYKETGKMTLVFEALSPQQIMRTDWSRLASRIPKSTIGVQICGRRQLSLIAAYDQPLALMFRKFEHNWGSDFLSQITGQQHHILQHAARLPSSILVDSLPNFALTHDDEYLAKLVHDFQNKLLNIQLEHELMVRFKLIERFTPPSPLPGRDVSPRQRVEAIFQHLDWWSEYYFSQIAHASA